MLFPLSDGVWVVFFRGMVFGFIGGLVLIRALDRPTKRTSHSSLLEIEAIEEVGKAMVGTQIIEGAFLFEFFHVCRPLIVRLLEPREGLVGLAEQCIERRDFVRIGI